MSLLRRLAESAVSVLGGGILVFALLVATPGDPARRVLNTRGVEEPTLAELQAMREQLGLDQPIPVRFLDWFLGLFRGELGVSWRTGSPVAGEFASRLPATVILALAALLLAVVLSLLLGVLAAWQPGRWSDHLSRLVSTAALALPSYLIGVLLLDLVAVRLGWGTVIADGTWATVFLPALTLALASAAVWSRVLRSALLDLDSAAFLTVATARGSGPWRNLLQHRLPNVVPQFLTVVGLGTAMLLGGAPITETIFSWPGVGKYTVDAITARDMPVVTSFTMLAVLAYVATSLVVDLVIMIIDPRHGRTPHRMAARA
ncbi:MAG: ABC transporter permease [Propionibacteriales bacterium]|nr:ABC transporter permease [Propionibacteriales bacterium]